jgi:circadian clock protein KaiB
MVTGEEAHWVLTLYVNGAGPRSSAAIDTVRRLCDTELSGRFELTVYDAAEHPAAARRDNILALPTLIKHQPAPRRYVVGDLVDVERLRAALDLGPPAPHSAPQSAPQSATWSPSRAPEASTADGIA